MVQPFVLRGPLIHDLRAPQSTSSIYIIAWLGYRSTYLASERAPRLLMEVRAEANGGVLGHGNA